MSGTYKVTLSTPFGPRSGLLQLIDDNGSLHGSIRAMGFTSPFSGGTVNGGNFEFSGVLNAGFGRIPYKASGTVTGSALTATAATKFGNLRISGTAVAG
jgi:hypothetical protein